MSPRLLAVPLFIFPLFPSSYTDDLHGHLRNLASIKTLPDLNTLLENAKTLVERYASQSSIQIALSASESSDSYLPNKVPKGSPWVAPANANCPQSDNVEDAHLPDLVEIVEPEPRVDPPVAVKVPEDAPKIHKQKSGFTGDRVLHNSEIFLQDFGWWMNSRGPFPKAILGASGK
ncbi:hypothetical protein B0H10DRAFT_1968702 [Mycena sp. CBHHK59/15]|nr:hypothetical protein B0H10DRAFT_1968702 [Mycena sp. CBHHK59/15]